jgi:hypothetical protein
LFSVAKSRQKASCVACQRYDKSQKRKRDSREKDVGNRLSIGSNVNRSYFSPDECQLFIKKQTTEIKRLNRLLLKQAPESIQKETETVSESVEGVLADM